MSVLFGTRLRRKLLAYCFTHPDSSFYVRELATLIDEDPGNLSRELRRLEGEGLFRSFSRGKAKFYSLNKKYPLFQELKKIVSKTEGLEGSLRALVHKYKGISTALIYGSYAANRETVTSDVDLILVGDLPENRLTREIRNLESKFNREINFTSYREDEFDREKRKKGSFLNTVLKGRTILLKGETNVG